MDLYWIVHLVKCLRNMKFWKEKPGVISESSIWVCSYSCYLHIHESLIRLILEVITQYKHDRHLVG